MRLFSGFHIFDLKKNVLYNICRHIYDLFLYQVHIPVFVIHS